MAEERLHLIVKGIVQGVFFRSFTKRKAASLNLKGYVKNLDSGHVEILAEGQKENLQQLLSWSWQGSPGSRVEDIDVKWEEYKGEFDSFDVAY